MQEQQDVRLRYEPALRVIGRHLDAEPAYNISVLEVEDGFAVRSHPSRHRADGRTVVFTWERLNDLVVYQTAGRGVRRRPSRHAGLWEHFPNGHEDFFRALGHQLDKDHARSLSVDEVNEAVSISYIRPKSEDVEVEKVFRLMTRADIEAMLVEAQSRRQAKPVAS